MNTTRRSLLDLARSGSEGAWQHLESVYVPLIRTWLKRASIPESEVDDLIQELLTVVYRRLPEFDHSGRTGAFRSWLKNIVVNIMREFWREHQRLPIANGGSQIGAMLNQLDDPRSDLSRHWNREHDRHVALYLLQLVLPEFEDSTAESFRRYVMAGEPPAKVADELGMSTHAVYVAKSRVMRRLRQHAEGLSDDLLFG